MKILNIILIAALYTSFASSDASAATCPAGTKPHPSWPNACIVEENVSPPCSSHPGSYYVFKHKLCVTCAEGYAYNGKKCVKAL